MKQNFENFKRFLKNLSINFSAICLFQIWCETQEESWNSNYIFDQATTVFISTGIIAEEEVYSLCERWFCCKSRQDFSIHCDAIESLRLEIINKKLKKIILYRHI